MNWELTHNWHNLFVIWSWRTVCYLFFACSLSSDQRNQNWGFCFLVTINHVTQMKMWSIKQEMVSFAKLNKSIPWSLVSLHKGEFSLLVCQNHIPCNTLSQWIASTCNLVAPFCMVITMTLNNDLSCWICYFVTLSFEPNKYLMHAEKLCVCYFIQFLLFSFTFEVFISYMLQSSCLTYTGKLSANISTKRSVQMSHYVFLVVLLSVSLWRL